MKKLILIVMSVGASLALAGDPPANSVEALKDDFARKELGKGWKVNFGSWKTEEGVLRVKENAADKHAAAARKVLATSNAVYEFRFRFVEKPKAFHFGFDPAKGELDKKGHLFSVVVTPKSWKILRHVDKARRKEVPNKTLAEAKTPFEVGKWYTVRVTTWGQYVTARVEGKEPLKAEDPTFSVKKPTLVFRCLGDGVEIDDLIVWKQKGT